MNDKPKALTDYTLIEQDAVLDELNRILINHYDDSYQNFVYTNYQKQYESKNIYFYVPLINRFFYVSTQHLLNDLKYRNVNESVKERLLNFSKNEIFCINDLSDIRHGYYSFYEERSIFYPEVIDKFKEINPYCAIKEYQNYYEYKKNNSNTYGYRWHRYSKQIDYALMEYAFLYIQYPQIEQLVKSGFEEMVLSWTTDSSPLYARNFKKGNNINEITKLPKFAWQRLKDENIQNISMWNELRVWIQKDNLSKDQLETILNLGITETQTIKAIRNILNYEYNGKKLYTLDSLLNYLERVDMYQAINTADAIVILRDYIKMAIECNIEPITNSNSLKREHDVVMRNHIILLKEKRQEFQNQLRDLFIERGKELSKYEYKDKGLIVIAPKTINDLLQEGSQNHNCVGSYVERFVKGQSNIFFIRKEDSPEKSYITIELNSDFSSPKQAFYSSNREITNREDLNFILDWVNYNRTINKEKEIELNEEKDITDDMF